MMKKQKKLLIFSAIGVILLVIILLILFRLDTLTLPGTSNTQDGLDYANRSQSEFALGGTLSGQSYTPLDLDVASCPFGQDSVGYGFGHTVFAIDGLQGTECVFRYGSEIENPMWDGKLVMKCKVPSDIDIIVPVNNYGIDLSSIKQHCTAIK